MAMNQCLTNILFKAERISEYIRWARYLANEYPNKFVGSEMFRTNMRIYSDNKKGTEQIFEDICTS